MATYAYKCEEGHSTLSNEYGRATCKTCARPVKRDYKREAVGIGNLSDLKRTREVGGTEAMRDLFLPTAKDFEGPKDPDGSKGLDAWNEQFVPAPENKNPKRPERPTGSKKVL